MDASFAEYKTWAPDKLLDRIVGLEKQLKIANRQLQELRTKSDSPPIPKSSPRPFQPSRYSTRHIALKFAYLGQRYNGFEHHNNNKTRIPAIEAVLWKALVKAKFISPPDVNNDPESANISWEGCDYSKCGRTDRGVSAFGQVIGIRVRSKRPVKKEELVAPLDLDATTDGPTSASAEEEGGDAAMPDMPDFESNVIEGVESEARPFDDVYDELPYVHTLNRLLPPDIRVLAWCPAPDDFSARFSCRERRYRYFFSQPAFSPTPGVPGLRHGASVNDRGERRRDGWLDIEAMKVAAKKYEGLHDFRNLCKVDASKQLDNFMRRIFVSEIREVHAASEPAAYVAGKDFSEFGQEPGPSNRRSTESDPINSPKVYQFVLHGSAFLWHQVRHMVAILFLVGQGLESPSIVDSLLDTTTNPGRPQYEMADDAPLVLWDCIFPDEASKSREDSLPWIWAGDLAGLHRGRDKFGHGAVVDELWQLWRKRKLDEILAGSLLNLAIEAGGVQAPELQKGKKGESSRYLFQGGNAARSVGVYVPVMKKATTESVEVINRRYRERRGMQEKTVEREADGRGDHEQMS